MAIVLILFIIALSGLQLVAAQLPVYKNKFGVGIIDVEVPVIARNISDGTVKETGEPAFQLETVLFSLYYPTVKGLNSTNPPHPWVPRPIDLVARGFTNYLSRIGSRVNASLILPGLTALAGPVNITAAVDVPLSIANTSERYPIVIFSHGDSALRTWYSNFGGEIASRGYITVFVEHRDGSCPGTMIRYRDGRSRNVTYLTSEQLSPSIDAAELRKRQLNFRQAEIEEVVKIVRNISEGGGKTIYDLTSRGEGKDLENWSGRIDMGNLVLAGHSFGGGSTVQTLQNALRDTKGSILLDPASGSASLAENISIPVLIIDSEQWSQQSANLDGDGYFANVKRLALNALDRSGAGWFMTLLGSSHVSITDVPLLNSAFASFFAGGQFNATIDPVDGQTQYVEAVSEFLEYLVRNGSRRGILDVGVNLPQYTPKNQSAINSTVSDVNQFWEIHVAPPAQRGNGEQPDSKASMVAVHLYALILLGMATGFTNV